MRFLRHLSIPAIVALVVVGASEARANGRFPDAQSLVGSADGNVLAIETTFGVLVSTDGGGHFRWVCEAALGFGGMFDPVLQLTQARTLIGTLPFGLVLSDPAICAFARPSSAPVHVLVDVAGDPLGETLVALSTDTAPSTPVQVSISTDRGADWTTAWTSNGYLVETIDVAPGHPQRMYISSYGLPGDSGTTQVVLRSDDGGATFALVSTLDGAYQAFVAGVDPTNPDTVYVRAIHADGTSSLLRSIDAGLHFTALLTTTSRMNGFALSDDGRTVWAAALSATEGVYRLDPGATMFQSVSVGLHSRCLRWIAGRLYQCTSQLDDGFALGVSMDMGAHFTPVLSFSDVEGPDACGADSGVAQACESAWPTQQQILADAGGPRVDGGGGSDAGMVAMDVVDVADGGPRMMPQSGCHCVASGAGKVSSARVVAVVVILGFCARGRARGRRR